MMGMKWMMEVEKKAGAAWVEELYSLIEHSSSKRPLSDPIPLSQTSPAATTLPPSLSTAAPTYYTTIWEM